MVFLGENLYQNRNSIIMGVEVIPISGGDGKYFEEIMGIGGIFGVGKLQQAAGVPCVLRHTKN